MKKEDIIQNSNINKNDEISSSTELSYWVSFEKSLPPAMAEVLLFIPDKDTGLGYVRVGYYDPDGDRIAISSIPIRTDNTELLEIMDKISQNNVTCNDATHWRMMGDFPKPSEYVGARTSSMVIAQMSIVDNIR